MGEGGGAGSEWVGDAAHAHERFGVLYGNRRKVPCTLRRQQLRGGSRPQSRVACGVISSAVSNACCLDRAIKWAAPQAYVGIAIHA